MVLCLTSLDIREYFFVFECFEFNTKFNIISVAVNFMKKIFKKFSTILFFESIPKTVQDILKFEEKNHVKYFLIFILPSISIELILVSHIKCLVFKYL